MAEPIPIHRRPVRPKKSPPADDFILPAPKRSPLVKPGRYVGVTTEVTKLSYRGLRDYLLIFFDLWDSAESMGCGEPPVARGVPGFFNLTKAGRSSKYVRLLRLIFPEGQQARASDLVGKQLEVEVATVQLDADENSLPEASLYSRVQAVVGRA